MISFKEKFIRPLFDNKDSENDSFVIGGKFYSYKDFHDYIEQIYDVIYQIEDTCIAIYTTDDIRTYASIVALWYSGKFYVPLNPNQPLERHNESIISVNTHYVLSSDGKYQSGIDGVETIDTGAFSHTDYIRKGSISITDTPDEELAYVLFTSGSTGKPKGIKP